MNQRIFLTGGTGFVGRSVLEQLLASGCDVNALVRDAHADLGDAPAGRVRRITGDLFDASALDAGLAGCDAVVHLVGIIGEKPSTGVTFQRIHVEGTRSVLEAARRASVGRFVHMSALGARADAVSEYHRTKHAAEQLVRGSGLEWTILRPSMIHGPRGEFTRMQAAWARKQKPPFLFMPYFGAGMLGQRGAGKIQPIYVEDVARAFVEALDNAKTLGRSYDLAGPDVLTWPELHRAVARAVVGKNRWVMPLPVWKAKLLARVVPASLLPFNRDQVIMSQEDNTADVSPLVADFGWAPRPFRATLETYAGAL